MLLENYEYDQALVCELSSPLPLGVFVSEMQNMLCSTLE